MVLDTQAPARPTTDHPAPAPPTVTAREHVLILQTPHGLERLCWTDGDLAAQQRARALFEQQRAFGYRLYRSDAPGAPAEQTTVFDPQAHEIIGVMPLRGGA